MNTPPGRHDPSPLAVALLGLTALALAMGVGRFAFTPLLPMMQTDAGLTVAQGGWLASANYIGYLAGALCAARFAVPPRRAIQLSLAAIGLATVAMAATGGMAVWWLLRAIPGFASAWVLVYVSAWTLGRLAAARRTALSGLVYAGVGVGITAAGLATLALLRLHASSAQTWAVLGIGTLIIAALARRAGEGPRPRIGEAVPEQGTDAARVNGAPAPARGAPAAARPSHRRLAAIPEFRRFVFCHGAYGLGYIIPATFLPVMAKQVLADPQLFGWVWPVFGVAAALSTIAAARVADRIGARAVWILANVMMGLGDVAPVAFPGIGGLLLGAVLVGGTFMVITMVALEEARLAGGAQGRALMASMTAAFGVGQFVGPLVVSGLSGYRWGFDAALLLAAAPLFIAAVLLYTDPLTRAQPAPRRARNLP